MLTFYLIYTHFSCFIKFNLYCFRCIDNEFTVNNTKQKNSGYGNEFIFKFIKK